MKTIIQKHISDPQVLKEQLIKEFPGWRVNYSSFADQITMKKSMEVHRVEINNNDVTISSSVNKVSGWFGIMQTLLVLILIGIDFFLKSKDLFSDFWIWIFAAMVLTELVYYFYFKGKIEKELALTHELIESNI